MERSGGPSFPDHHGTVEYRGHRTNGPVFVSSHGVIAYKEDGLLHCVTGPAYYSPTQGRVHYYYQDRFLTRKLWRELVRGASI